MNLNPTTQNPRLSPGGATTTGPDAIPPPAICQNLRAMRQRKLGSHTPPCHRRMVITTLFSVLLAALQRRPVLPKLAGGGGDRRECGGGGVLAARPGGGGGLRATHYYREGENSQMKGADFTSQKFAKVCKNSQNFAKIHNILFCTKIPFNPTRNGQRQCAGFIFTSISQKCVASRLSGCKPTLHIPIEQEHVGETPGFIFIWEVVAILVVRGLQA